MTGVGALLGLSPPPRVFVAATGAGAGLQASLWSVPGSSSFLVGAAFPYAAHETERFLGFRPMHFCDEDTAVELAIAAYLRGREATLADAAGGASKARVIGLGLTASVASLAPHRGDHRVFVATIAEGGATVWSARLPKGTGEVQRSIDGELTDRLGLRAILSAAGIASDHEWPAGVEVSSRKLSESELRGMLYRRPVFGPGGSREASAGTRDLVLFPGSFDPCHDGHRMTVDAIERQCLRRVAYAVTADPVHKPALRAVDLLDRVASIRLSGGRAPSIVLTEHDPLFIDKAQQFPGAGIALGIDALLRMLDPSWGPEVGQMLETFRALGTTFYVVGRVVDGAWTTIDDAPIPGSFRDLFRSVDGRHDVSSTELRTRDEAPLQSYSRPSEEVRWNR
jgi:hypothetical protein